MHVSLSVIPIRWDIFGVAPPPIIIPSVKPLMRCAVALAGIALGTCETDVSSLMPAALLDGDNVIDSEARAVKVLTVSAIAALGEAHVLKFLGCERTTISFETSAAAMPTVAIEIRMGGLMSGFIGALLLADGIGIGLDVVTPFVGVGSQPSAIIFTTFFGVGGTIDTLVFKVFIGVSGTIGACNLNVASLTVGLETIFS